MQWLQNFKESQKVGIMTKLCTLESVINVAPGKFVKKNKRSPIDTLYLINTSTKGQIIPKADCRAIDSPKKRTNEFVFIALQSGNT